MRRASQIVRQVGPFLSVGKNASASPLVNAVVCRYGLLSPYSRRDVGLRLVEQNRNLCNGRGLSTTVPQEKKVLDIKDEQTANAVQVKTEIIEARGRELVLSPPALVVTREYEWGNIVFGFEQANRYTIRAAPGGYVVGYIAEENSLGKTIARNFLRTHRSFRATVLDKHGDPVFVIRRPFYVFSTSMFVETPEGILLGEVHMNWHVYRRRYGLYSDGVQFARVDEGFLAVDFDVRDEDNRKIASANRDFTGFARELFTDAGQYVLRLDPTYGLSAEGLVNNPGTVAATVSPDKAGAKLSEQQRAVILSTAIAIDFDYFSLHSRRHGSPWMFMPIPGSGGAASANTGAGGAGAMAGADVAAGAMAGDGLDDDEEGIAEDYTGSNEKSQFGSETNQSDFEVGGETLGSDFDAPQTDEQQWGTFEEADYGFQDDPSDDGTSDWGSADVGGDEEGGIASSVFGVVKDIFFSDD